MTCIGTAENDSRIREPTPEEIPPNLNYYAMDPIYDPDAVLGWAATRIEERINRGMLALNAEDGKVYPGWRLLESDPDTVAFNVYRSTDGGPSVKLNDAPLAVTTDFIDSDASLEKNNIGFIKPPVDEREQDASEEAGLRVNVPVRQYRPIPLKGDVQSVAMVAAGDLDGDGVYDFVVKHPGQGKDPGRVGPNIGSCKYDGHNGKTGEFLWRIDLGWNVDRGIWWTPMLVRDLDGDNELGSCMAADIDPSSAGLELAGSRFYYSAHATRLDGPVPPQGLMALSAVCSISAANSISCHG